MIDKFRKKCKNQTNEVHEQEDTEKLTGIQEYVLDFENILITAAMTGP